MAYDEHINHYPPQHWHGYRYNDTERAHSMEPYEECCGKDEDCVCVTEEDVNMWNTISSISALTGVNFDDLSSFSAIATSADNWNSNYNTVSANSANWNKVSGLDDLSALNSAYWQSASDIVSSHSAKWNRAVTYSADIQDNSDKIDQLSGLFNHNVRPFVDENTILGDGSSGSPYTVKNYENYIKLVNYYASAIKQLYDASGNQNWISRDATTDVNGINPYLKTLFNAIGKKDNDQDITLNNHGDLIQWIIKNLNVTGKQLQWEYVPASVTSNKESVANLTAEGTMYYYGKPVTAYQ